MADSVPAMDPVTTYTLVVGFAPDGGKQVRFPVTGDVSRGLQMLIDGIGDGEGLWFLTARGTFVFLNLYRVVTLHFLFDFDPEDVLAGRLVVGRPGVDLGGPDVVTIDPSAVNVWYPESDGPRTYSVAEPEELDDVLDLFRGGEGPEATYGPTLMGLGFVKFGDGDGESIALNVSGTICIEFPTSGVAMGDYDEDEEDEDFEE